MRVTKASLPNGGVEAERPAPVRNTTRLVMSMSKLPTRSSFLLNIFAAALVALPRPFGSLPIQVIMGMVNVVLILTLSVYINRGRSIGLDTLPAKEPLRIAARLALEFHDSPVLVSCLWGCR